MTDNQDTISQETPPGMISLTIDGQQVTVPEGTNVLEAAKTLGVDISAFCYHPGLSIAACCRQCLVSVENQGKLQPSCQTIAQNGMVVDTEDQRSKTARRQMLEFTLLNHPIDCPICDKAGECTLQKLYFDHDNKPSRVDVVKVRKPKVVDLGPTIVLDAERCILCTRCIRVCDEVAGEHQLEMRNRGDHEELGTAPGAVLDNPYSLNTVDVCPVGALTAKDFRFTMRAWELMATPSTCTGCATGCSMEVHHRDNRVWRLIPRHNPEVNDYWMCDEGRMTYKELRDNRITTPSVDGLPSKWDNALEQAAALAKDWQGSETAVLFSAHETNETNYALTHVASALNAEHKLVVGTADDPERADDILRDADTNPNKAGATQLSGASFVEAGKLAEELAAKGIKNVIGVGLDLVDSKLDVQAIAIARQETEATRAAQVTLPSLMWAEDDGSIINRKGLVGRLHKAIEGPGNARPAWQIASELAAQLGTKASYDSAKSVFAKIAANIDSIETAQWGGPARTVQLRFAGSRG